MLIPFEELPKTSRLWIYPSSRKLSDEEVDEISETLNNFVQDWSAHGTALEASFEIRYNRFIILAINQEFHPATGCSIDSSVAMIQEIEKKYSIDLLDKMNVTFKNGEHIAHKSLIDFKKMAKEKAVSENTIVFNNLINTIEELDDTWEIPAYDSWHGRFF